MTALLRGHDRRVGRRPVLTEREQFLKMVGQGWSVAAAARELGVSRSSANNWKNGYRVIGADGTVVVVGALAPTPQPISARFPSQEERLVIADELCAGTSVRGIATLLGRARRRSPGRYAATAANWPPTGPSPPSSWSGNADDAVTG